MMAYLYELEIQSFPNHGECDRFGIGIFRTRREAEETARRYLAEIPGFRDYYCEYSIQETELIGDDMAGLVHVWFGWNWDEDENEVEILSSPAFSDGHAAEKSLEAARKQHQRQDWALNRWQVGRCEWTEGFVRERPDGQIAPTLAQIREQLCSWVEGPTLCGVEFTYDDEFTHGFPVRVSRELFLMAIEDDYLPNGFTVRRLRDVYDLRVRPPFQQTIAQREGLTDFTPPDVDITDWKSLFASLNRLGKHISVAYGPECFFRIGLVESVEEDHVVLRCYDAEGVWQDPRAIPYREITAVTIGDRYVETISKYV